MRPACVVAALLILVGSACKGPETKTPQADELKGWRLSTETDKMDNTPAVYLSKLGESRFPGIMLHRDAITGPYPDGDLIIRCTHGKTALFVVTDHVVDNGRVRIRFDHAQWQPEDEQIQPQVWSEASDHRALYAPYPIGLAKRLSQAERFLFEYSTFQQQPRTIVFNVSGLAEKLNSVAEACGWPKTERAEARAEAKALSKERALAKRRDVLIRTALRTALSKYVGACHEKWLKGRWCWYDESSSGFKGGAPFESKEAALDDAVQTAKNGVVFTREMAKIENELKRK